MLTVTGTGITVKLVSAVARDPLLARTVTLPTFTAVIVPLVAIPLVTATMLGSPVTVPGPAWEAKEMLPLYPVTVLPAASRMRAVKVRVLPDCRSAVFGETNATAAATPDVTVKLVSAVARDPLLARTVTFPATAPVRLLVLACPLTTVTVCGKPVTVPGPAWAMNVMSPT